MGAVLHTERITFGADQVLRKRHKEWESFTVPLCQHCLHNCLKKFLIRYAVAAVGDEECGCPCRKMAA